jgi:hypothetical protein
MNWFLALTASLLLLQQAPRVEQHGAHRTITNAPQGTTTTRNVLIVGNSLSYFNEMPWMLEQIALSKKALPRLHVEFSGGSGMTLEQHWRTGKAAKRINDYRWDFVVLQAQSTEALRTPAEFETYARRFDAVIRSRGARTVILGTWAPRDSRFSQHALDEEYEKTARVLGATLAPAGSAWQQLQTRGIDLFEDDIHPNVAGSYLVAAVLYAVIYGASPSGATHSFDVHFEIPEFYRRSLEHDRIDEVTAAAIQTSAWTAVRRANAN